MKKYSFPNTISFISYELIPLNMKSDKQDFFPEPKIALIQETYLLIISQNLSKGIVKKPKKKINC